MRVIVDDVLECVETVLDAGDATLTPDDVSRYLPVPQKPGDTVVVYVDVYVFGIAMTCGLQRLGFRVEPITRRPRRRL